MKRGARHHWWPKSLSKHWTNQDGHIHRIDTNGKISRSTPTVLARISGGHDIVFDAPSPWEQSFERFFDSSDGNFPRVVSWLDSIARSHSVGDKLDVKPYFRSHDCDDDDLVRLLECVLSLVIRSPRFREGASGFAESIRGPLPKPEKRRLEAANLKQAYSVLTEDLAAEGKFAILVSDSREFIYGDGFYSNLSLVTQNLFNARILVPLTPAVSVLYARPPQYNPEPRLVTAAANPELVSMINETTQIYSKECLFYRAEEPSLISDFTEKEHRNYGPIDPIEDIAASVPGVPTTRLD